MLSTHAERSKFAESWHLAKCGGDELGTDGKSTSCWGCGGESGMWSHMGGTDMGAAGETETETETEHTQCYATLQGRRITVHWSSSGTQSTGRSHRHEASALPRRGGRMMLSRVGGITKMLRGVDLLARHHTAIVPSGSVRRANVLTGIQPGGIILAQSAP